MREKDQQSRGQYNDLIFTESQLLYCLVTKLAPSDVIAFIPPEYNLVLLRATQYNTEYTPEKEV